jgi:NADH-quinone oxidoreductase subunit L
MSQLGYMFFALGVGAYPAAIFHLMTHAFFKALLFLGAGSVIHAMSDEQDMRKMGGIWKKIPTTYTLMWIGSLALAGVPFFAGYYSKDIILEAAYADHTWFGELAYFLGIAAAIMTAFYSARLLFMTFHGKPRADKKTMDHVHESPPVMLTPLMILGVGAVFAGWFFYEKFVGHHPMWNGSIRGEEAIEAAHHVPYWVKKLPIAAGALGLVLGWIFYLRFTSLPEKFVKAFKPLHALFFNKWYFDELYTAVFVKPAGTLGRLFFKSDKHIVDGFGPDGVAKASRGVAGILSRFQSGYVFQYAFVMIIGLIAIVSWFYFKMTNGQG